MIRDLGRNGVRVFCVSEAKNEAIYSKYCEGHFIQSMVERRIDLLDNVLSQLIRGSGCVPVVLPGSDSAALTLARLKDRRDDCLIPISRENVLKKFVYKRDFYRALSDADVPHPRTAEPGTAEMRELSFPIFVKPSFSQGFHERFRRKGFVVSSESELRKYLRLMAKLKVDVLVQEIIPGPPTNHYFVDGYLDERSRPLALFARRRLRMWPSYFGNSSLCVSVPILEVQRMKDLIVEFLAGLKFRGLFSAEFKVDQRDAIPKLLEVNARGWWFTSISAACGVNIVLTAYLDSIGKAKVAEENYEIGHYAVNFLNDARSSAWMFAQKRLSLRDWVQPFTGKMEWAIFARDDPRPWALGEYFKVGRLKDEIVRPLTGSRLAE